MRATRYGQRMASRAARRSTPDDVTGADDQSMSYVINCANKTAALQLPPRPRMTCNRARPDRRSPTSIPLTPLDVPEHRPRRRLNSHAVPFHRGPRTPWCAAVGQRVPVRTTPHRRASRPTATLSSARARARLGAPTTFPLLRSPTPLRSRRISDRHQRPRCEGALLARPERSLRA